MPNISQKLQKYADLTLHGTILIVFLKFIVTPRAKLLTFIRVPLKIHSAPNAVLPKFSNFFSEGHGIVLCSSEKKFRKHSTNRVIEKIRSYVSMYLDIRRKCRVQDTCLTKSLFLCRALRENGVDARVQFGVREADVHERQTPEDWKTVGHCWVTVPGERIPHNFPLVVTCP